MSRIAPVLFLIAVSFGSFVAPVSGQVRTTLTSSTAFPVSLVSPDNALATEINPSALGALDSWSLSVSHVDPARGSAYADRQTSVLAGFRLFDGMALGTGIDLFRERSGGLGSFNSFLLGAAFNAGPSWSLGTTWRVRSPRDGSDSAHSADVALSFRPSPTLGLSVIGRDLAGQRPTIGGVQIDRSLVLGALLRPLGDDRFFLELASVFSKEQEFGARMAAGVQVPLLGRLAAALERNEVASNEVWTISAGLDVRLGGLSVAPAFHMAKGEDDVGWSLIADLHGDPRDGAPGQKYVAKIRVESLSTRGLLKTIAAFDQALRDPRIVGVLIQPRETGAGLAVAQEVRLMIAALKARGKRVVCHLESPSGSEFYMCAGTERVTLDPAGTIRLMGLSSESLYFGELLRDIGARADFVRIGDYKSAPEQFTNTGASDPAREQRTALLDDGYHRLTRDLSTDLRRSEDEIRALIDKGPFAAQEALTDKLVAATIDPHDLEEDARTVFGARTTITDQQDVAEPERFGPTGQIGVVVIDGSIVDGDNVDVPFFDVHMSGGRTISKAIDSLADNPRIRAIVLRIDSPGGAVTASDQIWRAVMRARAKKPVVASMGEVAASGGYYVAAPATEIWASPSTITGSIGVFYGKVDIAPLVEKYGVRIEIDQRGKHAGADSLFRPFTDEERAALTDKVRIWYRQFLERVADGRHMPVEQVDNMARGRVWSGDAALENGLIDALGGFGSALARARELGHLGPEAGLVVLPERPSSLLDYVTGGQVSAPNEAPMSNSLKALVARLMLLSHTSGQGPMALWEGPVRLQ